MRNNTNPDILYLKSEEGIQEIFILEDATSGYFPFACPSENIQLSGGLSNAHTISFFFFGKCSSPYTFLLNYVY